MSSPAIILTSEFVTSHDEGAVSYLDRRDRQVDKEKVFSDGIEGEAKEILSLDVIKSFSESDFASYLNYMGRQQALEKKSTLTNNETLELAKVEGHMKTLKENMSQSKPTQPKHLKVRGLFDKENDQLNEKQKQYYKQFYSQASKNGALLFQDVVSFDTSFLIKQGLFDPTTGELDAKKLKDAGRVMMKKYFELENLTSTGQWVGAIHYNTDNFHIHFSTTENMNTRQMITVKDKKTGNEKQVPNGLKKEATIREMKSVFMNQLIDRNQELNQISQLRNQLVSSMRTENHEQLIGKQLGQLISKLPDEKSKWQYKKLPKETKQLINECVQTILSRNKDYPSFQSLIKEEGEFRKKLYHTKADNDYYKNKLKDMDTRLGNALLKNMKSVKNLTVSPHLSIKHLSDEKNENHGNNIKRFSTNNQKKILEQFPEATEIKTKRAWLKNNRVIDSEATPITISIPVMDEETDKIIGFSTSEVYDIKQTNEKKMDDIVIEYESSNLDNYSVNNQKKILEQFPEATEVKTERAWLKDNRVIDSEATPITISIPVMDEETEKIVGFSTGEIYDIKQTIEKEITRKNSNSLNNNLDTYSQNNQSKILHQYPDASKVQSRWAWLKENRTINPDTQPILIAVPIIDDETGKVIGFGTGEVYDVTQTTKRELPEITFNQDKSFKKAASNYTESVNIYRYSKKNQKSILERFPKAKRVLSQKQWLDLGYKINPNEKPVFIEVSFKKNRKDKPIKVEIPVYDMSQVGKATPSELRSLQREYDKMASKPYKEDNVQLASRTVKKISNLLEKDYDNERRKYEKERLDRKVEMARYENDFSY